MTPFDPPPRSGCLPWLAAIAALAAAAILIFTALPTKGTR